MAVPGFDFNRGDTVFYEGSEGDKRSGDVVDISQGGSQVLIRPPGRKERLVDRERIIGVVEDPPPLPDEREGVIWRPPAGADVSRGTLVPVTHPLIYSDLVKVMGDVGYVGKTGRNKQQGYNFRGIDEVMKALQPALIKHGVIVAPKVLNRDLLEYTTSKGTTMQRVVIDVEYTFYAKDGSSISATVTGEGADSGDKATSKAMAAAMKYAITQVFSIPTEEPKDSEHESPDLSGGRTEPDLPQLSARGVGFLEQARACETSSQLDDLAKEVASSSLSLADKAALKPHWAQIKNRLTETGVR